MKFLHIGCHEVTSGWAMKPHSHHEMIVVVRGGMGVEFCGKTLQARAGDLLFYPAQKIHREFIEPFSELATFLIVFSGDWNPDQLHQKDSRGRIGMLCEWLHAERDSYYAGIDRWNDTVLGLIFEEYMRLAEVGESNLVEEARRYIRSKIDRSLSLDDLAQNASLSKYHFLREYERLCGLTPMADVRRIRLQQARNYILTSNDPLKVIATRVGLVSENHLSRLLKETFGLGVRQMRSCK